MEKPGVSLRQRTRRAVRGEIADAAMSLFLSQGFEATTVEDIAKAAGISRRSYFRYFTSKDEAFAEALSSIGETIAETLTHRPVDEPAWLALRRAFDPLLEHVNTAPNAEAVGRLMLERPAMQHDKDAAWQTRIAAALVPRMASNGRDDSPLRAEALSAAAVACLHLAQARWLEPGETRALSTLLDTVMDAVRPLPGREVTQAGTREE